MNYSLNLRHIYLADDDSDDRAMFAEVLSELDYQIVLTQAADGKQLMDLLHLPPDPLPEIIFLDLNMPRKNGFDCLDEIYRRDRGLEMLKVVVFSTSSHPEAIERSFELGASLYAVKPNTYQGLKNLMREVLQIDWNADGVLARKFETLIGPCSVKSTDSA